MLCKMRAELKVLSIESPALRFSSIVLKPNTHVHVLFEYFSSLFFVLYGDLQITKMSRNQQHHVFLRLNGSK